MAEETSQVQRISLFLPSLVGGGAERVMLSLAKNFVARGHLVDFVLVRREGEYLNEVPDTIRIIDLQSTKPRTAIPELVRYLRREKPCALLSSLRYANLAALWASHISRVRLRCVVREASTISQDLAYDSPLSRRLMPNFIRWFYPWAHKVVAPSRGVAVDLVETTKLPIDCISLICNPVSLDEIKQKMKEAISLPWEDNIGSPIVVSVGRLTQQKDFSTLILAFARLRKQRSARLIILGEGEERTHLETLVHANGLVEDVWMPGFVANPFAYMAMSSVFVLSSRWEGLPNVLIEALACGIPVVSTDCPSGPVEILENGRYGVLTPVGDADSMMHAIQRVLDHQSPVFDSQQALIRFDPDNITNQFLSLLLPTMTSCEMEGNG